MSDFLEKLFHTTKAKEFAASFKEAQEKYASPLEFVRDVAAYLPIRLYEHYYDDTVPHSAFGLACANLVQNNFPEEQRWRPFAQQTWFAVQERKRSPLKLYSVDAKSDFRRKLAPTVIADLERCQTPRRARESGAFSKRIRRLSSQKALCAL